MAGIGDLILEKCSPPIPSRPEATGKKSGGTAPAATVISGPKDGEAPTSVWDTVQNMYRTEGLQPRGGPQRDTAH